jgi:methionyl-tRNA formyltransferase
MSKDLRIVFMGTPDFAVPSLDILISNNYKVAGVVTAPDKPAGRGQHIHESAVKKYAVGKGLNILQPEKLKNENFLEELKSLKANLFIIVAFRMLPEKVWQMPEFGTFNLHASLLPQYRGAAPINWAVINGEKETGVTTFFLQHEIDTGNIILQEKISIDENENAGDIHDKLSDVGAQLVLKTVQAIENNTANEISQDKVVQHSLPVRQAGAINSQHLKHAPKIFKEDCRIDWSQSVMHNHNLIRGLSPHPAAFTYLDGKILKIYRSKISDFTSDVTSRLASINITMEDTGTDILTDNKTFLQFKCADGFLDVLELQLEGKKRMTTEEFLRGHKFS